MSGIHHLRTRRSVRSVTTNWRAHLLQLELLHLFLKVGFIIHRSAFTVPLYTHVLTTILETVEGGWGSVEDGWGSVEDDWGLGNGPVRKASSSSHTKPCAFGSGGFEPGFQLESPPNTFLDFAASTRTSWKTRNVLVLIKSISLIKRCPSHRTSK